MPIMENQMEKQTGNEMESGIIYGLRYQNLVGLGFLERNSK